MIEKITGEHIILEALENVDLKCLTIEEALELICSIFRENLTRFSAIENIHNAGKIANVLCIKLFPSRTLSRVILQWIQQGRYQEFTDDPDFEYAILRGCAIQTITEQTVYTWDYENRWRPFLVDETKTPDSYGLRREQIEQLRQVIIQGSGMVEYL